MIITGTTRPDPERLSKYRDAEDVFETSLTVETRVENNYYSKALGKIRAKEKLAKGDESTELFEGPCLFCGKTMTGVSDKRKYCDDKCKYQYRKKLSEEVGKAMNDSQWRVAQIKLMHFEGFSPEEIAKRLGYKKTYSVKQQLSKHGIVWEE